MSAKHLIRLIVVLIVAVGSDALIAAAASPVSELADDPSPPDETVKLIFIHHSTGGNWLADETPDQPSGGLGQELMENNYFVSATNYGWGPDSIGSNTDIPNWPDWFTGPNSSTYLNALYNEFGQNICGEGMCFGDWTRMADPDPSRENEIIMFKSCFPNSDLYREPSDQLTVADAQAVYNDILTYFATRQDKLFIVITAPPLMESATTAGRAANARAFNDWLLNDWLDGYAHDNVAVFDYYNVLTSNGGDVNTNDYDVRPDGNHHYWNGSQITHTQTVDNDYSAYPSGDSHPTSAGHRKATAELVALLNVFYNRWQSGAAASLTLTAPDGGESWAVGSQHEIAWSSTGTISNVSLAYSTDGFTTTRVISSSIANTSATGVYTWTTPPTPTRSARVRVTSVVSPTVVSATSGAFTLYDPSTFTHTIHLPLAMRAYSAPTSTNGTLIQASDLSYQGAFRLPDSPGTPDDVGWEWSNWASAATYYADGDPDGAAGGYPGSLFGVGHDHTQHVSEISIPVPVNSPGKDVSDLNTAEALQDFHDVHGSLFGAMEMPRVGLAYLPAQGAQTSDKLYFAWAPHLDEGATDPSHGWCELDLANPQAAGPWRVGGYVKYVTSDYMFEIPRAWADAHVSGRYLATGRSRDGGQGAQGPSIFAIAPWSAGNPPAPDSTLAATPLLLYESVYDSNPISLTGYHHSDEWTGAAWMTVGDKSAVVFVGTKGTGDCWYGCADGTDAPPWPDDCDRGWWSSGFAGQLIFYDPADLSAVARGAMETWEPQPYSTLDVDDLLYHVTSDQQKYHVGALAFDRARGMLYLFEPFGDGDKPLVHVWHVE